MAKEIKPFINIGPGDIIQRNLKHLNWTNKDLAEIIDMSEKSISLMINNKQSITIDTAVLLGKAFNTSAKFWLNLEQNYKLREKDLLKAKEDVEIRAKLRTYMPFLEMKKKTGYNLTKH